MNLLRVFARFGALVLALAAGVFVPAANAAEESALGLVIAYQTAPANRPVLRQQMRDMELQQFDKWKRDGVLQDYRILFSRYVDSANWDMIALLTFAKPSDLERWKTIEEANPAGLSPKAAALTTSISTAPADLSRAHGLFKGRDSVFLVIPYEVLIPTGDYLSYVDNYLVPQTEGWMNEGVLAGYGLYVGKLAAARPWASLLVLEYHGDEGLAEREAVVAKVRNRLKDNPKWKAIADSKQKVRAEKQAVVADALTLSSAFAAMR